jgi:hypothetical protein
LHSSDLMKMQSRTAISANIMNPQSDRDRILAMTEAVRSATEGDFSVRVGSCGNADELDALAGRIDELFETVEARMIACAQEQKAIEEVREQHRRLEENIPGVVFTYCLHPDGSYSFPYVNAESQQLFDIEPEEVMRDGARIAE